VRWSNAGTGPHAATSGTRPTPDGIWNTGSLNPGSLPAAVQRRGTFPYFDGVNPTNPAWTALVRVDRRDGHPIQSDRQGPGPATSRCSWSSADTRKYDLLYVNSMLVTSALALAQANIARPARDHAV